MFCITEVHKAQNSVNTKNKLLVKDDTNRNVNFTTVSIIQWMDFHFAHFFSILATLHGILLSGLT